MFTPHGECVRLSDGRVLAKKLCELEYTSPVVHEETVYFVGRETLRRPPARGGRRQIKLQRLWESDDVEGELYASPVCHDGSSIA